MVEDVTIWQVPHINGRVSAIQQKMDKLDEAFLYWEAIDVTTYGRQRDKLREELTLAKIDHHAEAVGELDVEGILAFAERILPRASDLWVQASLDYKQRVQQLFFPATHRHVSALAGAGKLRSQGRLKKMVADHRCWRGGGGDP